MFRSIGLDGNLLCKNGLTLEVSRITRGHPSSHGQRHRLGNVTGNIMLQTLMDRGQVPCMTIRTWSEQIQQEFFVIEGSVVVDSA